MTVSIAGELARLREYQRLERQGRLLTPEGLRLICEANGMDPEKIGKHMLEVLARICCD